MGTNGARWESGRRDKGPRDGEARMTTGGERGEVRRGTKF